MCAPHLDLIQTKDTKIKDSCGHLEFEHLLDIDSKGLLLTFRYNNNSYI